MSWLDELLSACEEAETPTSWIYWSGIATISACVAPNIWFNRKMYKVKPNLYVMLIGESGLGKGFPVFIAKQLVEMAGVTRVISGRNTIQSILKSLATSETDEKTGVPKFKDGRGFIVASEFATLLQDDKDSYPILTDLYDGNWNPTWTNTTKVSGTDRIVSPMITLLGGSSPAHFSNVVPASSVEGGFIGRVLASYEDTRSKINPLSDTEAQFEFPFEKLADHLKLISTVKGPFRYGPGARARWDEWYYATKGKKVHDPTGSVNRLPDTVLKVGMCISLSKGVTMEISLEDLEESIDKCMGLIIAAKKLNEGKGKGELAVGTKLVLHTLYGHPEHKMPKSKILQLHWGEFDVYALDRIIQTLESAGLIRSYLNERQMWLEMLPDAVAAVSQLTERH